MNPTPRDMLVVSLMDHAQRAREFERKARKGYQTEGPWRTAALRLADVHAAVAEVYERELRSLDKKPEETNG